MLPCAVPYCCYVLCCCAKVGQSSPHECYEVPLAVRDVLGGLQGVQLADQLGQTEASDGGQHLQQQEMDNAARTGSDVSKNVVSLAHIF